MRSNIPAKDIFIHQSHKSITERRDKLDVYKQDLQIDDHLLSFGELSKRYGTDLEAGLSHNRAALLLLENGPNVMKPKMSKNKCQIFMFHMFCGFAALLWVGVILSLTGFLISYFRTPETVKFDHVYLASVIFMVIVATGFFGFYQEAQHAVIAETFTKMNPKFSHVIRDGDLFHVHTEKLVLGDLVRLQAGDCVPADMRIIQCSGMKVDNSSITGESDPQPRSTEMSDLNPLETANLAFYGTNVLEGSGKGIIIACGDNTLMGHIATLTSGLVMAQSPIQRDIARFLRIITIVAISIGTSFFVLAVCLGYPIFDVFAYFIAIIVANVPEGLVVTMTTSLTLIARKLYRKNCLCKNLTAIETLGCTTIICSDKTGTLTENKMTVSHMYYDNVIVDVLSETYEKPLNQAFNNLCMVGILCSRAKFADGQSGMPVLKRNISGDASESAVLKCMEILTGRQTSTIRSDHPKIFEIPFNSINKYQLSIHVIPDNPRLYLVMKGAPERVIDRCAWITINNTVEVLSEADKKKLMKVLLELSYMGERVLGFADMMLPEDYKVDYEFNIDRLDFPTSGLRFVGFMALIDPPRPGVSQAVAKCRNAGIKVIMVTGDHPMTAMAIAKKVGIISIDSETVFDIAMKRNISASKVTENDAAQCEAAVITGNDLREMDPGELDEVIIAYDEIVFARTSPQQKLQIVEAFQRTRIPNIVGVTGDGINDSPALKKADIGIAMGITGSDVSKEAADIIILDDDFASIIIGIEEGRLIFDNIKKSIAYLLTSNVPEMVPFFLHVLADIPLPLSVVAILIIDVGTDLWPSISLAYEKPEADIMYRPPRDRSTDRLVTMKMIYFTNLIIGVIQTFAGLACWFFIMAEYGFFPSILIGMGSEWLSAHNDVRDSYQREWSVEERRQLQMQGYSAYFLGVVLTQVADCIIAKTRRLSILQQGMNNSVMNFSLVFEMSLALLVVFCPYVNDFFSFKPIHIYLLAPAIPFALLIVIFDEMRKALIRRKPGGWFDRETYF